MEYKKGEVKLFGNNEIINSNGEIEISGPTGFNLVILAKTP